MLNLQPTYVLIAEVIFSNIGGAATGGCQCVGGCTKADSSCCGHLVSECTKG